MESALTGSAATPNTPTRSKSAVAAALGPAPPGPDPPWPCASRPYPNVVGGAQGAEELQALERPGEALAGPTVGPEPGDVCSSDAHDAAIGPLESADDVEQGGLAGTVGPDEARDLAGEHLQ